MGIKVLVPTVLELASNDNVIFPKELHQIVKYNKINHLSIFRYVLDSVLFSMSIYSNIALKKMMYMYIVYFIHILIISSNKTILIC